MDWDETFFLVGLGLLVVRGLFILLGRVVSARVGLGLLFLRGGLWGGLLLVVGGFSLVTAILHLDVRLTRLLKYKTVMLTNMDT